ncbi:MAG: helix-turn-helix domain-containing protein [Oscillospiraceae bacterium]|nr:helix-turn-helix domain-containing protein [Oscillospiraceae bacterium]
MMQNSNRFMIFMDALDFIEHHLTDEFTQEDIANACYCSLSSLQKIWKACTHTSVKEYISKRRLTLAGRDMRSQHLSVLDTAMKYGYNSHEVFTRAFTKVWGVSPSKFRKEWKGDCTLYPKLNPAYLEGDVIMNNAKNNIKKFDVSEFYDYLRSQAGTYVLCFDVVNLMPINENLGREAGDKVILESFRRINESAGENMLCLRMGGDEFVMITESADKEKVTAIAQDVLSHNGETTPYPDGEVAVSLRCGVIVIQNHLKYSVLCEDFNKVLDKARATGTIAFSET